MSARPLLMIPGPIELADETLAALGSPGPSHLDPELIELFGRSLEDIRTLFGSADAQPFLVSGSGTLAMEMALHALVAPGHSVLVVDTGYFSERMAKMVERLGARAEKLSARAPGSAPSPGELEHALSAGAFDAVTLTHVDTSTGVRLDVAAFSEVAHRLGVPVLLDGVCSAFGETIEQDAWHLDAVLTASQKALAAPPGLALLTLSRAALARLESRATRCPSLYLDALEWLPVMRAYEARKPAYFATPPVHLVRAVAQSLSRVRREGMGARVSRHAEVAKTFRAGLRNLGLPLVAEETLASNTISGVYYPEGVDAALVGALRKRGYVVAGGLVPSIASCYFRVGHMGETGLPEIERFLSALGDSLAELRSR
jgi:alanine-glyoxylate transaminase / serine-glyoxylate transaminase / serine-pyruvate transaminase